MALQLSAYLRLFIVPPQVSSAFWPLLPVFNFAVIPFQIAILFSQILFPCLSRFHSLWLFRRHSLGFLTAPNLEGQTPVFLSPGTGWPVYTPGWRVHILVTLTIYMGCRVTVLSPVTRRRVYSKLTSVNSLSPAPSQTLGHYTWWQYNTNYTRVSASPLQGSCDG